MDHLEPPGGKTSVLPPKHSQHSLCPGLEPQQALQPFTWVRHQTLQASNHEDLSFSSVGLFTSTHENSALLKEARNKTAAAWRPRKWWKQIILSLLPLSEMQLLPCDQPTAALLPWGSWHEEMLAPKGCREPWSGTRNSALVKWDLQQGSFPPEPLYPLRGIKEE